MANLVTVIVAVMLIMMGAVGLATSALSSTRAVSMSLDQRMQRIGDVARTRLSVLDADLQGVPSQDVDIWIENTGQTPLTDFRQWDVLIEYYDGGGGLHIERLGYTAGVPSDGEWTVEGIYADYAAARDEVYEPGILNPGEEAVIRLHLDPAIPSGTSNRVVIGAVNGVTLAAPFSR